MEPTKVPVEGPEPIPVTAKPKLIEAVKPKNRESDKGGWLGVAVGTVLVTIAQVVQAAPEITALLHALNFEWTPVAVQVLGTITAVYYAVTREKQHA